MEFFNSAVGVLQTLVVALGAGLGMGKSKLLDFPTMPTTAESLPLLISFCIH